MVDEEVHMKESETQKPLTKKLEVEDRTASKLADGVAGTDVGIARTLEEIVVSPIRIAGRIVDGTIQGVKHGIEISSNPVEAMAKPIISGVVGAVKGTMKGIEQSARKIGEGLSEIGENITTVGKTLEGKEGNNKNDPNIGEKTT